jgi:lipoprotein-anchoring transpeptidase ErfK/SrfK
VAIAWLVVMVGCGREAPGPTSGLAEAPTITTAGTPEAVRAPTVPPPPAAAPREPIGYRSARHLTIVHAAPNRRAPRRGRIEARHPFAIFSVQPAADCEGEGWAEVERGGYACLERALVSDGPALTQPVLPEGRKLPFIYAKPRVLDRKTEAIASVPRYRDHLAFRRGEEPLDFLAPDRQYAFVKERKRNGKVTLVDDDDRVVPVGKLKIARESSFAGRDLERAPIPAGLHAAWSVSRPAQLRESAARSAAVVKTIGYHQTLHINPEPTLVGEELWHAVPDGAAPGVAAYVIADDMNHWIPGPAQPEAGADELWLDVELGQQTLAVMRGPQPIFITLVSTGAGGSGTPRGLFRVYEKLAISTMRSGPNADDPYYVEGVPWIQYFHRRYAFHAAYWHDDFGKRRSHGCVNLSPSDAAYVFSLTSPKIPAGWNSLYEHPGHAGTLVRVRKGTDPVPDLRLPLGVIEADDETAAGPDPAAAQEPS